jgi:hypothetical protein
MAGTNPIDGSPLTHDYDKGYWARYLGTPLQAGGSLEWRAGWRDCNRELRAEAQDAPARG